MITRSKRKCSEKDGQCENENNISISILNDDCLLRIFTFLEYSDKIRIERVCKRWRKISLASWSRIRHLEYCYKEGDTGSDPYFQKVLERCGPFITQLNVTGSTPDIYRFTNMKSDKDNNLMLAIGKHCKQLSHLYIKRLRLSRISDFEEIASKFNSFAVNLRVLHFTECIFERVSQQSLSLKQAVNLKELSVESSRFTSCSNWISGPLDMLIEVTDRLETLNLSHCCRNINLISSYSWYLDALKKFKHLQNLNVRCDASKCKRSSEPFCSMAKIFERNWILSCLQSVDDDVIMNFVLKTPLLEDLTQENNSKLTDEGFGHLKNLKHLINLSVRNSKVSEAAISDLGVYCKFEKIRISESHWATSGLIRLVCMMPQLKYLDAGCTKRETKRSMLSTWESIKLEIMSRENTTPLLIDICFVSRVAESRCHPGEGHTQMRFTFHPSGKIEQETLPSVIDYAHTCYCTYCCIYFIYFPRPS